MKEKSPYTDQQLFALIAGGDELAFREVFDTYNRKLYPFINAVVKSDTDAREIMQEVFLKLWLHRDKLGGIDNPGGWLHTIASNAAYDYLRSNARYELRLKGLAATQPQAEEELQQQFDAKEARNIINDAVRKLPVRRRQIFQMSKIEGFSRREIADHLNISENTVRNQLVEAVAFVQDYLKANSIVLVPLSVLLITIQ